MTHGYQHAIPSPATNAKKAAAFSQPEEHTGSHAEVIVVTAYGETDLAIQAY